MNEQSRGTELIAAGDLNANMERTEGQGQDKKVTSFRDGAHGARTGQHGRWYVKGGG